VRAWIYERAFRPLTEAWYAAALSRMPVGTRMLDIGVGTAGSLVRNGALLRERDITVVGIDIDGDYLREAERQIKLFQLEDRIVVRKVDAKHLDEQGFGAAYFGASFMLMDDPPGVLAHVASLLAPGGLIFFTQTFQERRSPFWEKAKPLLHKITTIHFGQVTYEDQFLAHVDLGGCEVEEQVVLGGRRGRRTARLIVARAKAQRAAS
jgi:ubiquinone/menaquinone biosynthesis C-methylase UbiE